VCVCVCVCVCVLEISRPTKWRDPTASSPVRIPISISIVTLTRLFVVL